MTSAKDRRVGSVVAMAATALLASLLSSCLPCAPIWGPGYPDLEMGAAACESSGNKGKWNTEFTLKDLAGEIDGLEKYIEKYGSIVPKQADIWGEARLMLHRQEFEQQMSVDLSTFQESFQASIYRSDQAYLASALSLQAAVSTRRRNSSSAAQTAAGTSNTVVTSANNPPASGPTSPPAPQLLFNPSQMISTPDTVIMRQPARVYQAPTFSPGNTLSLEPTLKEDQKARYLYHLNELRRINEGDDNSDAPGYTLNLVRIPISVLAGSCTQTGWGGECTVTATPHLSDDLLPQTFHAWVINDLVNLLTLPVTKIIENNSESALVEIVTERYVPIEAVKGAALLLAQGSSPQVSFVVPPSVAITMKKAGDEDKNKQGYRQNLEARREKAIHHVRLLPPVQSGRADEYPVPATQLPDVIGPYRLVRIAAGTSGMISDHRAAQSRPYHLDVRAFLQEELNAAYDLLKTEKYRELWQVFCTPTLVEAIHSHDVNALDMLGEQFKQIVEMGQEIYQYPDIKESVVRRAVKPALAWTIIVEAALLNDRLIKDMRATQTAKGCPCVPGGWLPLYLPHPPAEVCQLFNDYVRCRWPLYVFALDPETDDQNVIDQYDMRREMQLALSLAFTSGQIGAGSMTRYVRRIEEDMDTIAINRTIVGFSHGPDTFGWRFYPRVQTPPIPGNLTVIFRDMLWGARGPRFDLRYRRLENGVRECDALVVMPSIVPYVDMEFTSNWFALANPKCKQLDLKDAMRLSQRVQAIRESSSMACDTHTYRPGDPALLLRRLEQLSLRLPLQHQLVNVPFENTHGGYEMLATGVSNLAPRLSGWYGAPGIDPTKTTNLFLVGNNFSVTQTRVIVGGQWLTPLTLQPPLPPVYYPAGTVPPAPAIPQVELLSRQVVRVSIPPGAFPDVKGSIDVHVATPYGISAPLSVPMIGSAGSESTAGYAVDANHARLQISYKWKADQSQTAILASDPSDKVRITWDNKLGSALKKAQIVFYFTINGQEIPLPSMEVTAQDGAFEIGGEAAKKLADNVLSILNGMNFYDPRQGKPLPTSLDSSKIVIQPVSPPYGLIHVIEPDSHDVKKKNATNSIHVDLLLRP